MEEVNIINLVEKMIYSINDFKDEMVKSMNFIRQDINDIRQEMKEMKIELKDEISDLRQELRDYKEENNKRWEENNKRWEENNKRWEENNRRWEKYEANRKEDKKFLIDTLINYDISISAQLGDSNAEKMRKLV